MSSDPRGNGYQLAAYLPDDASWPALLHMANVLACEYRDENLWLREQIAAKDREIAIYRRIIASDLAADDNAQSEKERATTIVKSHAR